MYLLGQQNHIIAALAQRRNVYLDDRQPVIKIEAESRGLAFGLQIAVRRRDDSHVERYVFQPADPPERAFFKHSQQLRLQAQFKLADLVQKERAAFGLLEQTFLASLRIGESAFLIAEQLAFDQVRGDCGAVDRDERSIGATRAVVNGL